MPKAAQGRGKIQNSGVAGERQQPEANSEQRERGRERPLE
jgi:hypothetical protein